MTTEPNEDCVDFGHEWEAEDEYYLGSHVRTAHFCTYCGEEREDV